MADFHFQERESIHGTDRWLLLLRKTTHDSWEGWGMGGEEEGMRWREWNLSAQESEKWEEFGVPGQPGRTGLGNLERLEQWGGDMKKWDGQFQGRTLSKIKSHCAPENRRISDRESTCPSQGVQNTGGSNLYTLWDSGLWFLFGY